MRDFFKNILLLMMSKESMHRFKMFLESIRDDYRKNKQKLWSAENFPYPPPFKLNVGCGENIKTGWVNIDLQHGGDLALDVRNGLPFADNSCEVIYSEHFLEHLAYPKESIPFLEECRRVLIPGGIISVGVPDSRYVVESCIKDPIDPDFLKKSIERDWGYPDDCRTGFDFINYHFRMGGEHHFAFDFTTLKSHLERAGFRDVEKRDFQPQLDSGRRAEGSLYVQARKTK